MATYINLENLGTFLKQLKEKYKATNTEFGGIKIGYAQNEQNYPVQLDSVGKAYVEVPLNSDKWTPNINNNTWSRLCYVHATPDGGRGFLQSGCKFILNLQMHRNSVVYNDTFLITTHYDSKNSIIKIAGSTYQSGYTLRVISGLYGHCLVEIKDAIRPDTNWVDHKILCSLTKISCGDIVKYTSSSFEPGQVDGGDTTSGHALNNQTGKYEVPVIYDEKGKSGNPSTTIPWNGIGGNQDAWIYSEYGVLKSGDTCGISELTTTRAITQNLTPQATDDVLGGFKTGYDGEGGTAVKLDGDGRAYVEITNTGILDYANDQTIGGIKTGYTGDNGTAVKLDGDGRAYVEITNTGGAPITTVSDGTTLDWGNLTLQPNTVLKNFDLDRSIKIVGLGTYTNGQVSSYYLNFKVPEDVSDFNLEFGDGITVKWANGIAPFFSPGEIIDIAFTIYPLTVTDGEEDAANRPLLATWAKYF